MRKRFIARKIRPLFIELKIALRLSYFSRIKISDDFNNRYDSPLQKSNRLLQIFLGAFLLIAFRIWHLAVVQREEKLEEAQKPQRRTIVQQAERGSIVDRFGIPLATNRICYNASIYYSQFTQIPSVVW